MKCKWVFQQDSDLEVSISHTINVISDFKIMSIYWNDLVPCLNSIKYCVYVCHSNNWNELKKICDEEWSKLVSRCRKWLKVITGNKGHSIKVCFDFASCRILNTFLFHLFLKSFIILYKCIYWNFCSYLLL